MADPTSRPGAGRPRHPTREGWRRQCTAAEPRLAEIVDTYRRLGFEVLLVPVLEECAAEGSAGACTACFEAGGDPARYQVVYTRPGGAGRGSLEELF
ncbi:MAG: hypothetical protein SCH98_00375 [Deferrisomatales bacterium]|nr:hypothetical protein [Deferrisomatales bacterium]